MTYAATFLNNKITSIDCGTTSAAHTDTYDCGAASAFYILPIYDFGRTLTFSMEGQETLLTANKKINVNVENIYDELDGLLTGNLKHLTSLDGGWLT